MEKLNLVRRGSAVVVKYSGEITLEVASVLKTRLEEEPVRSADVLVVDLSDVQFMDSSGIGFLVSLNTRLRSGGKGFYLFNLSPQVEKTLALVQLLAFFEILSDEDELEAVVS